MTTLPILLNHDHTAAIGTVTASGDCGGLWVRFHLNAGITAAAFFNIFGNCGAEITQTHTENGLTIVDEAMIREWSLSALLTAAGTARAEHERQICHYPQCVENEDERCPRWLTGECEGPDAPSR
jgi:hypothetical protein